MRIHAFLFSGIAALSVIGTVGMQGTARGNSVLARPVVIGASVSAGFSAGKDLAQVLEAQFGRDCGSIESSYSVLFWRDPIHSGKTQSRFAIQREPTVLIAIDFLFWFGYSDRTLHGDPITCGSQRMELLRRGLGMLEPFACPIILADFPRDQGNVARMISPAHVPSPETVRELNLELERWSANRGNVIVLPLASTLERIQSGEETILSDFPGCAGTARRLLQSDGVHMTLEGLVWISRRLSTEMITRGWIENSEVEQDMSSILAELGSRDPPSDGATTRSGDSRAEESAGL